MRRISVLVLMLVAFSAFSAAQAPSPTAKLPVTSEAEKNEVYGGFLLEPTDFVPSWGNYKGFDVNFTHRFTRHFAGVFDYDWTHNDVTNTGGLDPGVAHNSTAWGLRGGPRYNILGPEHRIQPYAVALFGVAHFTSKVPYPTTTSSIIQKNWYGFSWAAGGGVDFRLTRHFGVRGQWDHVREPWGTGIHDQSDWDRISVGGTWRF